MKAKLENLLTGKIVDVHSTTDSPDSSYGLECWVDDDNISYGQCQFGAPLGFELIPVGQGGPGRGQGAPAKPTNLKKETKGIRLPKWLWEFVDEQEAPRDVVIEMALKKVHKLKTPPTD